MKKIFFLLLLCGAVLFSTVQASVVLENQSFYYSENFDAMEDGALPVGWTLVKNDANDSAQVSDHALLFKAEGWTGAVFLLFDYEKVLRPGLSMECDITRAGYNGTNNTNTNNSRAGFCYVADYNESTGKVDSASHVAPYTYKAEASSAVAVKDFGGKVSAKPYSDASGNALQFNWATRETPVHLKLVFNNDTQSPDIYIDGVEMKHDKEYSNSADRVLSGKIGLYAYNTYVSIDNIVISGAQEVTSVNSINCTANKYSNNVIGLSLRLNKKDTADKKIFAAIYDKTDSNKLVGFACKNWSGQYKDIRTNIEVYAENYLPENHDVAVFAWDMNGAVIPICPEYILQ